jgi:hypothetical protein
MPILQEQPPDLAIPSQIVATSLDPPRDLEYPHSPISPMVDNSPMPLILWSLGLLLGLLMLLARLPLNAPSFESLTEYVCDPLPRLPSLGNRFQSYRSNLRCRAGDQVIFQRQSPFTGTNSSGVYACNREGGLTRIWRAATPSDYGAYVFQSTCGDHLIAAYKNRAATYESTQRFVIAVAWIIILVSAIGLIRHIVSSAHTHQHKTPRLQGS